MATSTQPEAGPIRRLFGSATNLLATILALGRTRLELLSVEVQLEIRRVAELAVWLLVALHATILALVMLALWVIALFWDSHRLLAVGAVAGFFLVTAVVAALVLAYKIRVKPPLLHGTLSELARDSERLRGLR